MRKLGYLLLANVGSHSSRRAHTAARAAVSSPARCVEPCVLGTPGSARCGPALLLLPVTVVLVLLFLIVAAVVAVARSRTAN